MRAMSIALALALAGCTTPRPSAAAPSTPGAVEPPPRSTPIVIRTRPPDLILLNDRAFAEALKASGLPVINVRILNSETDPNQLLGKPNSYAGKVSWTDTRVSFGQPTAELFTDTTSMEARFKYLDGIFKSQPIGFQYMFRNDSVRILLRVPQGLTPAQANDYAVWLRTLDGGQYFPSGPIVVRRSTAPVLMTFAS